MDAKVKKVPVIQEDIGYHEARVVLARMVLDNFKPLSQWYREQHNIRSKDLNVEDACNYGTGGQGEMIDLILSEPETGEVAAWLLENHPNDIWKEVL